MNNTAQMREAAVTQMREYLSQHLPSCSPEKSHTMAVEYWSTAPGWEEVEPGVFAPSGAHSEELVRAALEGGDCAAWDAACRLSASLLEKGRSLPPPLSRFTAKVLRREHHRPDKRSSPWENLSRDLPLCLAISHLLDAGFKSTGNSGTIETAFEKVAEIAKDLGFHAGTREDNLRLIWRRHKAHVRAVRAGNPFYYKKKPGPLPINYPPQRGDRPRKK